MRLIILIPALNEAATIARVIRSIPSNLPGIAAHEVVVVDDGSTDATAAEARAAGASVVSHGANRGLGIAVRTGLAEALKRGADFIVNIDADGQFNPADIPSLLQPLLDNRADITTCTRFAQRGLQPAMPPIKVWGNRMVARIVSFATGQHFTDVACGFRALTREAALRLTLFGRFTYTQEMFLDAAQKDLRISEVPLRVRGEREVGTSRVYTSAWNYAARSAAILFRSFRDNSPFQVFGFIAAIVGGVGILAGGFVLVHWLQTGQTFPYRSMVILSAVLILLSAFFATIALLADMLRRQRRIQEELLYYARREFYRQNKS
ncbi:MAG: glycosyl transferase [Parcubacteria group bacterium Gr01-1014_106]|nr:MAG: glycosyl transferase [Parcubacteria group bacterium Gr01-1014_106]